MRTIRLTNSDMENPNKALVVFSNSIAEARYSLSLPTQKLLHFLISQITYEERKQGKFLNTLEFSLTEIKDLFAEIGRKESKDYKELLRKAVDELHKNYIKQEIVNDKGVVSEETWSWTQYTKFDEGNGIFIFKFNQEVSPLLLELKSYFKSNLIEYIKLSSKHSIKLYHLLRSNEYMKNKIIFNLDELKYKLGILDKYERWDALKNIVINPSFEELNKNTNYFFEYETERIGRSIGRVIISSFDKTDDRACTRFVRRTIEDFLKSKKVKNTTRDIFNSLSFSFNKEKETLYIRFKDRKALDDFISSQKDIKTEKQAYPVIDKGFTSYGIDKQLKSLFRDQIRYEYSSVSYIKPTPPKTPSKKILQEEEETYLDMHTLDELEKYVNQAEVKINQGDLKPIKGFGLTSSQAEKVFLAEGNKKIKDRVIELLKNGTSKLDIPTELIKEYQNENIL